MSMKERSNNESGSNCLVIIIIAAIVMVVGALASGCAYNRKTEGGALAEITFGLKVLPSDRSEVMIGSNKTVETVSSTNDSNTNCHSASRAVGVVNKQGSGVEAEGKRGDSVAEESQEPQAPSCVSRGRDNIRN